MSSFVLGTSVAVAWYLPEEFAVSARDWQARMLEERVHFHVPTLHYWEFANVLRTHLRSRALDDKLAADIWALHLDAPLQVAEPPTASVLDVALDGRTRFDTVGEQAGQTRPDRRQVGFFCAEALDPALNSSSVSSRSGRRGPSPISAA